MIELHAIGSLPLQSRRFLLERTAPKHAPYLHQLLRDTEFWSRYRASQNRNQPLDEITRQLAEESQYQPQQLRKLEWVITRKSTMQPVGLVALASYQVEHGRAEFLIGLSDARAARWGAGLEASLLVLDFAFNAARLHKLVCLVYGYNEPAQANAIELGFHHEGLLRQHLWNAMRQEFVDVHHNGMLEQQFRSNARLAALSMKLLGRDITQPPASKVLLDRTTLDEFKSQLLAFGDQRQPQEST